MSIEHVEHKGAEKEQNELSRGTGLMSKAKSEKGIFCLQMIRIAAVSSMYSVRQRVQFNNEPKKT